MMSFKPNTFRCHRNLMRLSDKGLRERMRAGFSITELLMVVLIMTLVSIIMANGLPAAINAYGKVLDAANAQVLLSTTTNRLRDELAVADLSVDKIIIRTETGTETYETSVYDTDSTTSPAPEQDDVLCAFVSMRTGYLTTIKWNESLGIYKEESTAGSGEYGSTGGTAVTTELVPTKATIGAKTEMRTKADYISYDPSTGVFTVHNLTVITATGDEVAQSTVVDLKIRALDASNATTP